MKLELEDIKRLNISPGETIVVSINIENLTRPTAITQMRVAAKLMRSVFDDPSIKILIVPSTHAFTIVSTTKETHVESYEIDPEADYERAMGVII